MCFPVNFVKFLRTPILQNTSGRLLHIIINSTFLSILIEKSKTDIYREGSWVYLTKIDAILRLIELVSQHFKKGNIRDNCQKYVFKGVTTTNFHPILRTCDKYITYTCVRENMLEKLKNRGAATVANLGVNDRLFKKYGR